MPSRYGRLLSWQSFPPPCSEGSGLKDDGRGKDWGGFTPVCTPEDVPQPLPAAVQGATSLSLSLNSSLHHLRLLHSFLSL